MSMSEISNEASHLLGEDRDEVLKRVEMLAKLLDEAYTIPGTKVKVGLDSLLGLVPVIGDVATNLVSFYIVWAGYRLGLSAGLIARMSANVVIDALVGSIPLIGDVFDLFFKANRRNVDLIRRHV